MTPPKRNGDAKDAASKDMGADAAGNGQEDWVPATGRSSPPPGRRGWKTREKILKSAIVVFGRKGFSQSTILDIAQEAGVAAGTVYQYFSDKADLFAYLLQELRERLHAETRMPAGPDGRLIVRDSVLRYLDIYREHAALFRVWWELLEPPTEFTAEWVALHEKSRGEMMSVIRAGQRQGIIDSDVNPAITADLMVSMFERPAYSRIVLGYDDGTDEELADLMSQIFGEGLLRS